jgi:hypothetical protein
MRTLAGGFPLLRYARVAARKSDSAVSMRHR